MDEGWGDGLVAGTGPRFTQRLEQWVADARIDAAADQRARERWLQDAAEHDATFTGVLLDLAERHASVTIQTTAGRRHHGTIDVIGTDFVALHKPAGADVLVAVRSITTARAGGASVATGERVVTTEMRLVEALAELASDRARVLIVTQAGGDAVGGELRSVGIDVATMRADGDPPTPAYVRIDSISEVALG